MANEDSVLREVDQELAEDRQWEMFRRHGPSVIAAALAILVFVAVWQIWTGRKDAKAAQAALEYNNASTLLGEDAEAGRAALGAIAEDGGGYGVLAQLREAALLIGEGKRSEAIAVYASVGADGGAPKRVRELARLRAAYYSLSDGRDQVFQQLDGIQEETSINGYYGKEILALAAMQEKDYESAHAIFTELSISLDAPAPLRERAENFAALADAGRAGVNVSGEARVEDIIDALAPAADPAAAPFAVIDGEASGDGASESHDGAANASENAGAVQTDNDANVASGDEAAAAGDPATDNSDNDNASENGNEQ
ncbi:MAG: tetratricopeptide repeat protein [Pseudomonadota bacterium]